MKWWILLLLPALVWAQDFPFEQEIDTIPVEIDGFQPFQPWTYGLSEAAPSFCDINADGDFDLFLGNVQGFLTYFENQGNPYQSDYTFITPALDSLSAVSGWGHSSPDFCDIDNDGDYDLFIGAGLVALYINNGSPEVFSYSTEADTLRDTQGEWVVGTHVEMIDIDDDGDFDLIGGEYQGYMFLYRNIGTPDSFSFYLESNYWENIDVGGYADPTFCDLDADNDYDLFIGNSDGYVWYYENTGDSVIWSFGTPVVNWLGIDVDAYASPEFCDVDGDGDFDLFVGREATYNAMHMGDVSFYENMGTPQMPQFQYITSNYLTMDIGADCRHQLIDINADGDLDLFIGAGDEIRYFENTGDPQYPAFTLAEEYYQGISIESIMPYFCDIDSDGDFDLFAGEGEVPGPPELYLYINRGTPEQADFTLYSDNFLPGDFEVIIAPTLADIDADGDYDLFITENSSLNDIYFYENIGSPTLPVFGDSIPNWQGIDFTAGIQRRLRFYDIDHDEDLDLFFNNNWTEGSENIRFYRNNGTPQNPTMELETYNYIPFEVPVPTACFCDIDSDSYTDLFVGDQYGGILFFHGVAGSEVGPKRPDIPYPKLDFSIGPNPANPVTWISFTLPAPQEATLAVYNILGAKVTTLASGLQMPGTHNVIWNASQYSSGLYIIRLETSQFSSAQQILVIK